MPVEDRLKNLYQLQTILSEIDRIRTLRGELPLEVEDLEDSIEGLKTRITKIEAEIEDFRSRAKEFEGKIKIIGNSSLEGAKIICESCDALKYINDFSSEENFIVIQPSLKKHYEDILLKNMTF